MMARGSGRMLECRMLRRGFLCLALLPFVRRFWPSRPQRLVLHKDAFTFAMNSTGADVIVYQDGSYRRIN